MTGWRMHAACRGRSQLWEARGDIAAGRAIHECLHHCPVLEQCRRWASSHRWVSIVVAGQRWGAANRNVAQVLDTPERLCGTCEPAGERAPHRRCVECGGPLPLDAHHRTQRCSQGCRRRAESRRVNARRKTQARHCVECGTRIAAAGNRKVCGRTCGSVRRARQSRNSMWAARRQKGEVLAA